MRRPSSALGAIWICAAAAVTCDPAQAGMPFVTLTDVARMRLSAISFFVVLFLVCALIFQALWNRQRQSFTWLPELSFGSAVAAMLVWSLAVHLVLTMISGARELMTPGAWEKQGATYVLKDKQRAGQRLRLGRQAKLGQLRTALWAYGEAHEGELPLHAFEPSIPEVRWEALDPSGARYIYRPGAKMGEGHTPIAIEPPLYDDGRLALFSDGSIGPFDDDGRTRAHRVKP